MSTILERMGLRERKPLSLPIRPTMEDQSSVFLGEPWSLKELQVGGPHHRTPIRQHKEDTMDIRKPLEQSRTWEHDGQGEETAGSQRCAVNKIKTCFRCGGGVAAAGKQEGPIQDNFLVSSPPNPSSPPATRLILEYSNNLLLLNIVV